MTAKEWGDYIVGQLHIPDPEQREWLKRQILLATDGVRSEREELENWRAIAQRIKRYLGEYCRWPNEMSFDDAILFEIRRLNDESAQYLNDFTKARQVLEVIASRRPVTDEAANAFYRSRQDAKNVLRKLKDSNNGDLK